jgi:gluconate 2-dehydrogenase gamma chain
MDLTRRDWVLAAACWTELLQAQTRKFSWFDAASAAEVEAIAAQIIPDDETAGAKGAGVIWFIDSALAGYDEDKRGLYERGLAETQAKRAEMFQGSSTIASLSADRQTALLKAIEKTEFFQQVRAHSVLGFFAHPAHVGSHDIAGWKLMGMEHSMSYQPPFGYYDAEAGKQ